jgi:preprotein translocase subunit SecG
MKDDPLFFVIVAAMAVVVGILMFGIGSFGKGGEFSRKYSNKMMRWRLIAQFVAVMLILLFVWLRGEGA